MLTTRMEFIPVLEDKSPTGIGAVYYQVIKENQRRRNRYERRLVKGDVDLRYILRNEVAGCQSIDTAYQTKARLHYLDNQEDYFTTARAEAATRGIEITIDPNYGRPGVE